MQVGIGKRLEQATSIVALLTAAVLLAGSLAGVAFSALHYVHKPAVGLHELMLSALEVIAALELVRLAVAFHERHRVHLWLLVDAATVFMLRDLLAGALEGKSLWTPIGYLFLLVMLRALVRYTHPAEGEF